MQFFTDLFSRLDATLEMPLLGSLSDCLSVINKLVDGMLVTRQVLMLKAPSLPVPRRLYVSLGSLQQELSEPDENAFVSLSIAKILRSNTKQNIYGYNTSVT